MNTKEKKLRIIENAILIGYNLIKDFNLKRINRKEYIEKFEAITVSTLEQLED